MKLGGGGYKERKPAMDACMDCLVAKCLLLETCCFEPDGEVVRHNA